MEGRPDEVSESPVITLPDDPDLVGKLDRKRQEYLERLGDEYTHPGAAVYMGLCAGSETQLDAYIKQKLLGSVLEEGSVKAWDFQRQLIEDPVITDLGDQFTSLVLERSLVACGVIDAYCTGQPVSGGTGLR